MKRLIMTPKHLFIALLLASPVASMAQDMATDVIEVQEVNIESESPGTTTLMNKYSNSQANSNSANASVSSSSGPGFNGSVDDGCTVPLDGGLSLLLAAGAGLGFKKYRDMKKSKAVIA